MKNVIFGDSLKTLIILPLNISYALMRFAYKSYRTRMGLGDIHWLIRLYREMLKLSALTRVTLKRQQNIMWTFLTY